jgi:carbonic anhydrase/acetyltransferase-like protein (isoleucine patch superfamily)
MAKLITPFHDKTPKIHPDAYVDCSSRIIGDVIIEEGVSVWPMVVLRADSAAIYIKRSAAILDLSLVEAPKGYSVTIEEEALISHRAVIHGAHVQKRALVGIGAIILDGAVISSGSIIGAGSVVAPGTRIPPNSLVMGIPGKVVRETTEAEREFILEQIRELYSKSRLYKNVK